MISKLGIKSQTSRFHSANPEERRGKQVVGAARFELTIRIVIVEHQHIVHFTCTVGTKLEQKGSKDVPILVLTFERPQPGHLAAMISEGITTIAPVVQERSIYDSTSDVIAGWHARL